MSPIAEIKGDSDEDTVLLKEMAKDAASYLKSYKWCISIDKQFLAFGVGGIIAIFLFEITPSSEEIDHCLWVVVGDLPPAYLVVEDDFSIRDALDGYVDNMGAWVNAVREGRPVEDLIPVNAPPTIEYANMLAGRLQFLETKIRPMINQHS